MKRRVVCCSILIVAILFNRSYEFQQFSGGQIYNFFGQNTDTTPPPKFYSSGCPWTYYFFYDYYDAPPVIVWDVLPLMGNIAVWFLILLFLYWYLGPRKTHAKNNGIEEADFAIVNPILNSNTATVELDDRDSNAKGTKHSPKRPRQIRLSDLMILIILIASVLGYRSWNRARSIESKLLSTEIVRAGGRVSESVSLPSIFSLLPEYFTGSSERPVLRIVQIWIDNPSKELLGRIVQLPHLNSLRVSGAKYDLKELRPLAYRHGLFDLHITGRNLDESTVQLIGRLKTLRSLDLSRTNITSAELASFGEMPRLHYINLARTDVDFAKSNKAPWTQTVQTLILSRPAKGSVSKITIHGWPNLACFACLDYDQPRNDQPISMSIVDSPKLKKILLDTSQRFDLKLDNLPQLSDLTHQDPVSANDIAEKRFVPNGVWIKSANFTNLPALKKTTLHIRNFDHIHIDNCQDLDCTLDIVGRYPSPQIGNAGLGYAGGNGNPAEYGNFPRRNNPAGIVEAEELQKTINGIGKSTGLRTLSLMGLPTQNVDLSPIANCLSLSHLAIHSHENLIAQLEPLSRLQKLEVLELGGVNMINIRKLFSILPTLKQLVGRNYFRDSFEVISHPAIESIFGGNWTSVSSIQLIDVPNLRDFARLPMDLQKLHIEKAPKLKGLLTHGSWPNNVSIDELNELVLFSAGTPSFRDEHFQTIAGSTKMQNLTLGYSGMTPQGLEAIGRMTQLQGLGLTGSQVDDNTIRHWQNIKLLKILMLDKTNITGASLTWIAQLKDLIRLAIDTECVSSDEHCALLASTRIRDLTLNGGEITPKLAGRLIEMRHVERLIFRNAIISNASIDEFSQAISARRANTKSFGIKDDLPLIAFEKCYADEVEIDDMLDQLNRAKQLTSGMVLLTDSNHAILTTNGSRSYSYTSRPSINSASERESRNALLNSESIPRSNENIGWLVNPTFFSPIQ